MRMSNYIAGLTLGVSAVAVYLVFYRTPESSHVVSGAPQPNPLEVAADVYSDVYSLPESQQKALDALCQLGHKFYPDSYNQKCPQPMSSQDSRYENLRDTFCENLNAMASAPRMVLQQKAGNLGVECEETQW